MTQLDVLESRLTLYPFMDKEEPMFYDFLVS